MRTPKGKETALCCRIRETWTSLLTVVTVVAVPALLWWDRVRLIKCPLGQRLGLTTGRHRQPSQPWWQLRLDKGGARDLFWAIGMFSFQFFLTIFNIFRYHDSIRRWRTTTTMNKWPPIPAPRHGHTTISHFHRRINTCLPPTFNTTTLTWGQIELEMHRVSSHRYAFYIFTKS